MRHQLLRSPARWLTRLCSLALVFVCFAAALEQRQVDAGSAEDVDEMVSDVQRPRTALMRSQDSGEYHRHRKRPNERAAAVLAAAGGGLLAAAEGILNEDQSALGSDGSSSGQATPDVSSEPKQWFMHDTEGESAFQTYSDSQPSRSADGDQRALLASRHRRTGRSSFSQTGGGAWNNEEPEDVSGIRWQKPEDEDPGLAGDSEEDKTTTTTTTSTTTTATTTTSTTTPAPDNTMLGAAILGFVGLVIIGGCVAVMRSGKKHTNGEDDWHDEQWSEHSGQHGQAYNAPPQNPGGAFLGGPPAAPIVPQPAVAKAPALAPAPTPSPPRQNMLPQGATPAAAAATAGAAATSAAGVGAAAATSAAAMGTKAAGAATGAATGAMAAAGAAGANLKGKGLGKTKSGKKTQKLEEEMMIKAAIKIQSIFRGMRARKHIGAKPKDAGARSIKDQQLLHIIIDCKSGSDMPSVNTMGGCDPLMEFRVCKGDPSKKTRGEVDDRAEEGKYAQTEAKSASVAPQWNQVLELSNVKNTKETFLQSILWDYNLLGNHACGQDCIDVATLLDGLVHDPTVEQPAFKDRTIKFKNLFQEGQDKELIPKCKVQTRVSFVEMQKWHIKVVKGARLPKVNTFGTIDGFIEIRLVRDDKNNLEKRDFDWAADPLNGCVFDAKTEVINDNMDPKWNADFDAVVPGYQNLKLQIILWDSNAPLPDVPIAQHIMKCKDITVGEPGQEAAEHKIKFSKIPKVQPPGDFKKTNVVLTLTYDTVFDKD